MPLNNISDDTLRCSMNQLRRLLTDSRFHTFLAVILLGYVVWNYGPQFHMGNQTPFASLSNRLICLVALAFIWGLTNIRSELNPFRAHHLLDVHNEIEIISRKLKGIQKQMKKVQNKKFGQHPTIHWHLVLGPRNSGKTHLLNCALDTDQDRTLVTATQDCAIWHTVDHVFVELGEHFLPNHEDTDSCRYLFQEFIRLCDRLHIQFHNVVVAVPINQVMTNTVDVDITRTHQMLTTLIAHSHGLPISVVFTKCDQMAGFSAFFSDLTMDERNQYCGIRLPFGQTAAALKKTLNTHLQQLNKRFHDRLLSRLHQEKNPIQRSSMHDFPYQFELFCARSIHFLNELLPDCDLNITGLFFTSSQQSGPSINHITSQLAEVFCLQRHPQIDMYTQQSPYFITELCQHLLPSFAENATHLLRPRYRMNPLFIPIVITGLLGLGIYQLYNNDLNRLITATNTIKNSQVANNNTAIHIAQQLTALEDSIKVLEEKNSAKLGKYIHTGHSGHLIKQAHARYDNLIKQDFVAALDQSLQLKIEQLSQASSHDHLGELYDALKFALQLQQPDLSNNQDFTLTQAATINDNSIQNSKQPTPTIASNPQHELLKQQAYSWYAAEWQRTVADNNTRQLLLNALSHALRDPYFSLPGNPAIISKAREILTSSSPDNIIYTILENENRKAPLIISDNTITETPINIPYMYTQAAYKHIFNTQIPTLCEKFAEGDWVLGYNPSQHAATANSVHMIQAVKTRYLNNYLNAWQTAMAKLHYAPTEKYSHLVSTINNLNSVQSPIVLFVQTIQANTVAMEGETQFNEIVGEHFAAINEIAMEDSNDPIHRALYNFAAYLAPIVQSNNTAEVAFNMSKTRLSKATPNDAINTLYELAKKSPDPLKDYLTALAENGWQLMIKDSRNYINSVWATIVLPEYAQHLNNRYPLFQQANSEMSLDEFAHFFAPNGLVDTFFKHYVQTFITDKDNGWSWKIVNGQQIALSDEALATFIRAKLIQKMFFINGRHHPAANFTLTPTALNSDLKNFTIVLNGQRVEYHGPNQPPEPISWPGPHQSGVFIEVADNADQKSQVGYPGLWGLFRLIDKAQLGKTTDATLQFSWIINEKRIDCQITADGPINPFTPGIVNQFRCPQSLI
jgi:type VI secretion system protein ImpL